MEMEMMDRPVTREDFERKFNLLHKRMVEGKVHIHSGLSHTIDGLDRVRYLPNGRIDFLSVNESARLQANSHAQFSGKIFQDLVDSTEETETD